MTPQDFANTLCAYATLVVMPDKLLLEALSKAAKRVAERMNPQDVANTLWADRKRGVKAERVALGGRWKAVNRVAEDMTPQKVAHTRVGVARGASAGNAGQCAEPEKL